MTWEKTGNSVGKSLGNSHCAQEISRTITLGNCAFCKMTGKGAVSRGIREKTQNWAEIPGKNRESSLQINFTRLRFR